MIFSSNLLLDARGLQVQHDEHRDHRNGHPGGGHGAIDEEPAEGGEGKQDARHEDKPAGQRLGFKWFKIRPPCYSMFK